MVLFLVVSSHHQSFPSRVFLPLLYSVAREAHLKLGKFVYTTGRRYGFLIPSPNILAINELIIIYYAYTQDLQKANTFKDSNKNLYSFHIKIKTSYSSNLCLLLSSAYDLNNREGPPNQDRLQAFCHPTTKRTSADLSQNWEGK